ncbi:mediator of DNA damage checkpoint protein 1 [Triticum aestivum]|uniref:mediator of DNA damage checkpoint protein 1 n=1 Tax=Triticum aestivum TaxID=4565 RepID=UPI001D033140|nr:mediator of DNA damage checkpoint protein 1-like [Triticum aestivum]
MEQMGWERGSAGPAIRYLAFNFCTGKEENTLALPGPTRRAVPSSTQPHSWRRWASGGLRGRFPRRRRRTRSGSHALAPPPSRSPAAVQPPAESGDGRLSADVSAVEPAGRRTRSKSNPRLPPPPTAQKKVSWATPVADTSKEGSKQRAVPNAKMRTRTQPPRRGEGAAGEASNASVIPPGNFDLERQPRMQPTHSEQQPDGTRGQRYPNKGEVQKEAQRRSKRQEPSGRENLSRALVPAPVRKSTRRKSRPLQWWLGERFLYNNWLPGAIGIKSYSHGEDGKVALRVESFLPKKYSDLVAKVGVY